MSSSKITKQKKPKKLTLTPEQERIFHFGAPAEYAGLMETLALSTKRATELRSANGTSLHVHQP